MTLLKRIGFHLLRMPNLKISPLRKPLLIRRRPISPKTHLLLFVKLMMLRILLPTLPKQKLMMHKLMKAKTSSLSPLKRKAGLGGLKTGLANPRPKSPKGFRALSASQSLMPAILKR